MSGEPNEIILNLKENILYENHAEYGTVSVVNTTTNNVAVGLTFSINPPNSGNIICHDQIISSSKHIMYDIDTDITCNANPNNNFVFNSWSGDIYDSSNNKLITGSRVTDAYPNDGTTDVIKLRASQFGTLTANFIRSNQVSIPPEFWAPLYGIIPAIITGIFIPSIISWLNGKRQRTHLRQYIDNIGKLDKDTIEKNITDSYTQGKISESHYQMLKERISEYYRNSSKDRL